MNSEQVGHFFTYFAQTIEDIIEKDENGTAGNLHNVVQRLACVVADTAVGVKETC